MAKRADRQASTTGVESWDWSLPTLAADLLQPPPADVDDVIDAAARCFARFGFRRTSVQDIARELGVDRTTVYRRVGNVEQIARLMLAREARQFLGVLAGLTAPTGGPEAVVEALAAVIEGVRAHPVMAKVLADERELVGSSAARYAPLLVTATAALLAPLLDQAMKDGQLARRDPRVVAEWLVRVGTSLVLVEAGGDLRAMLREVLVPALRPALSSRRSQRPRSAPSRSRPAR